MQLLWLITIFALQFTASYEADLLNPVIPAIPDNFNSQPHTRLTAANRSRTQTGSYFNSQPHTRLTWTCSCKLCFHVALQFTASYEADRNSQIMSNPMVRLQFTASYEADRHKVFSFCRFKATSIHSLIRG